MKGSRCSLNKVSFIAHFHLFHKYVLSTASVPGTVLGTGDSLGSTRRNKLSPWGAHMLVGDRL